MHRRSFLHALTGTVAWPAVSGIGQAPGTSSARVSTIEKRAPRCWRGIRIVDAGDVPIPSASIEQSLDNVTSAVSAIVARKHPR